MKYTNFHRGGPLAPVACSKFGRHVLMFVDISLCFIARDFRVDLLMLAPSRDLVTSSRTVKKLYGATLKGDRDIFLHEVISLSRHR